MADEFMTFYVFETFYMDLGLPTVKLNQCRESSASLRRSCSTPLLYKTDFNHLDSENIYVQYIDYYMYDWPWDQLINTWKIIFKSRDKESNLSEFDGRYENLLWRIWTQKLRKLQRLDPDVIQLERDPTSFRLPGPIYSKDLICQDEDYFAKMAIGKTSPMNSENSCESGYTGTTLDSKKSCLARPRSMKQMLEQLPRCVPEKRIKFKPFEDTFVIHSSLSILEEKSQMHLNAKLSSTFSSSFLHPMKKSQENGYTTTTTSTSSYFSSSSSSSLKNGGYPAKAPQVLTTEHFPTSLTTNHTKSVLVPVSPVPSLATSTPFTSSSCEKKRDLVSSIFRIPKKTQKQKQKQKLKQKQKQNQKQKQKEKENGSTVYAETKVTLLLDAMNEAIGESDHDADDEKDAHVRWDDDEDMDSDDDNDDDDDDDDEEEENDEDSDQEEEEEDDDEDDDDVSHAKGGSSKPMLVTPTDPIVMHFCSPVFCPSSTKPQTPSHQHRPVPPPKLTTSTPLVKPTSYLTSPTSSPSYLDVVAEEKEEEDEDKDEGEEEHLLVLPPSPSLSAYLLTPPLDMASPSSTSTASPLYLDDRDPIDVYFPSETEEEYQARIQTCYGYFLDDQPKVEGNLEYDGAFLGLDVERLKELSEDEIEALYRKKELDAELAEPLDTSLGDILDNVKETVSWCLGLFGMKMPFI